MVLVFYGDDYCWIDVWIMFGGILCVMVDEVVMGKCYCVVVYVVEVGVWVLVGYVMGIVESGGIGYWL